MIVAADYTERHLEIIDTKSGDRIVTVIEILSPTNKLPGLDRNRYLDKQQTYVRSRSNLVEIDLLRAGEPMALVGHLPQSHYRILVSASHQRPMADLYAFCQFWAASALRRSRGGAGGASPGGGSAGSQRFRFT